MGSPCLFLVSRIIVLHCVQCLKTFVSHILSSFVLVQGRKRNQIPVSLSWAEVEVSIIEKVAFLSAIVCLDPGSFHSSPTSCGELSDEWVSLREPWNEYCFATH